MPKCSDEEMLALDGWEIECHSPFEIRHEDGSFATGQAADIVLSSLKEELKIFTFKELAFGARFSYVKDLDNIWIKLSEEGFGLIAKYDCSYINDKNWLGQQICSFADTKEELDTLEVLLRES